MSVAQVVAPATAAEIAAEMESLSARRVELTSRLAAPERAVVDGTRALGRAVADRRPAAEVTALEAELAEAREEERAIHAALPVIDGKLAELADRLRAAEFEAAEREAPLAL